MRKITLLGILFAMSLGYSQTEIAENGGFETSDFTDWTQFPNGTQTVISTNPSEGTYCAELNNTVPGTASILKNECSVKWSDFRLPGTEPLIRQRRYLITPFTPGKSVVGLVKNLFLDAAAVQKFTPFLGCIHHVHKLCRGKIVAAD